MVGDDLEKSIDFDNQGDYEEYIRAQKLPNETPLMGDDVNDADTVVLYIIATLKQGFSLRQNQVSGLLADRNKYLVQMCVKGGKGGDFSKVLKWYNIIFNSIGRLNYLLSNEVDQLQQTLNILKSGLFSKDQDVANLCGRVFTKLVSIINENQQSPQMIE